MLFTTNIDNKYFTCYIIIEVDAMNEFTNQYTNFGVCFDEVIKYLNGLNINAKKIDTNIYFGYSFNNKDYIVDIVSPNKEKGYNIPYILVLPKEMKENTMMAVEVNNLEIENYEKLIMDGLKTAQDLTRILHEYDNPVLVPIIPSFPGGRPYFQQLSRECFDVKKDKGFYFALFIIGLHHKIGAS